MNEFLAMLVILLVIVAVILVGGKVLINWIDLQVKKIDLEIQGVELQLERERTAQKKEETRQALIEPVAARARAVNRLPWAPAIILLLFLVPTGMYVLGTLHPEWFEWTERDEVVYQAERRAREAQRIANYHYDPGWREWAERNREA